LAGSIAWCQVLAFIVGPLAAGQRQFDLCSSAGEVQRKRHKGEAALGDLTCEPVDFPSVQQELTGAPRLMVGPRALGVLGDMHSVKPHLPVGDVRDARPARSDFTSVPVRTSPASTTSSM